jgi:Raf kinase inhibitor-like YbhB/YbcL family protein
MIVPLLLGLTLSSPDLKTGAPIPRAFVWNKDGCNGDNRSPRLAWDDVPAGTRSLSLTVIDYDAPKAGGWVHERTDGIAATSRGFGHRAQRVTNHVNDFGELGWGGPCPPPGQLHHYTFTLRALDARGRVLATATMVPVYRR